MCAYFQSVPRCPVRAVTNVHCQQSTAARNDDSLFPRLTILGGIILSGRLILLSFYFSFIIRMIIITWRVLKFGPGDTDMAWNYMQHFVPFTWMEESFPVSAGKLTKRHANLSWKTLKSKIDHGESFSLPFQYGWSSQTQEGFGYTAASITQKECEIWNASKL